MGNKAFLLLLLVSGFVAMADGRRRRRGFICD